MSLHPPPPGGGEMCANHPLCPTLTPKEQNSAHEMQEGAKEGLTRAPTVERTMSAGTTTKAGLAPADWRGRG